MPRIKKFVEVMPARLLEGTFARIDAVLAPAEDRAGFVRAAIEDALRRRERKAGADPLTKHLAPPTARAARGGRAA